MNIKKIKKRGISPLIATVLLITFAIALGAIVMNWGRNYAIQNMERTEFTTETGYKCKLDVGLRIYEVNGRKKICVDDTLKKIDFMIENGPALDIEALHMILVDDLDNIDVVTLPDSSIERAGVVRQQYNYTQLTGNIIQAKISPVILINGEKVTCKERAITIEQGDILPCQ